MTQSPIQDVFLLTIRSVFSTHQNVISEINPKKLFKTKFKTKKTKKIK